MTLCPSTQAYVATKPEMGQQMSPSELRHPVPLSFEPVKNFFKEFVDAIGNTRQKPMDIRLKESELPETGRVLAPRVVHLAKATERREGRKGSFGLTHGCSLSW